MGSDCHQEENPRRNRRGLLFVVSAPSGAGKTTLCKNVVPQIPNLRHAVSYTTRPPRSGEIEGKDYFFIDVKTFQEKIDKNELIEWAKVHRNLYGTSADDLTRCEREGIDLILDIDTQGAATLKKKKEGTYVYILPPSLVTLSQRLIDRQSDSEEEIARRLQKSREEILHYRHYDYVIVNEAFENALEELKSIIISEQVRMNHINHAWIEEVFIGPHSKAFS
jgi:guanylate kinase